MESNVANQDKELKCWRFLLCAMGGTACEEHFTHQEREEMKTFATGWRAMSPHLPASRVPGWLLHCFAHYMRAHEELMRAWPSDIYDDAFPYGLSFRRYLGAWMYSVGTSRLGMTAEDVEAVYEATGAAMLPHSLLPVGHSSFLRPDLLES